MPNYLLFLTYSTMEHSMFESGLVFVICCHRLITDITLSLMNEGTNALDR